MPGSVALVARVDDARVVNLVISDETLLGGDDTAAMVDGYDPIPAAVARNLVNDAATDTRSRARCSPEGLARQRKDGRNLLAPC